MKGLIKTIIKLAMSILSFFLGLILSGILYTVIAILIFNVEFAKSLENDWAFAVIFFLSVLTGLIFAWVATKILTKNTS